MPSASPHRTGSGAATPPRDDLPRFPTCRDLVFEDENVELLKHLLPTLELHKCLQSPIAKKRRSPWVKAFCDLYHEAGPWSSAKFKNSPRITARHARYSFKSYRVKAIFVALEKYKGESAVHKELYAKLKDYKEKEMYCKDYMEACSEILENEILKPAAERAPIPTIVVKEDEEALNGKIRNNPQCTSRIITQDNNDESESVATKIDLLLVASAKSSVATSISQEVEETKENDESKLSSYCERDQNSVSSLSDGEGKQTHIPTRSTQEKECRARIMKRQKLMDGYKAFSEGNSSEEDVELEVAKIEEHQNGIQTRSKSKSKKCQHRINDKRQKLENKKNSTKVSDYVPVTPVQLSPAAAAAAKESGTEKESTNGMMKEDKINMARTKLEQMLNNRHKENQRNRNDNENDALYQRVKEKIDCLDKELMNLVLAGFDF